MLPDGTQKFTISSSKNKCQIVSVTIEHLTTLYIQRTSQSIPVLFENNLRFKSTDELESFIDVKSNEILEIYNNKLKPKAASWNQLGRFFYCSVCGHQSLLRYQFCPCCETKMNNCLF